LEALRGLHDVLTGHQLSKHGLNSAIALFELIFPATRRPPWLHLPGLILLLALYLALAYITHETEGFYPYSFLDPNDGAGTLVGYIFGILAGACVIFTIVWLAIWARKSFTPEGKRSRYDNGGNRGTDIEMVASATAKGPQANHDHGERRVWSTHP
jgi:hypothetical protein